MHTQQLSDRLKSLTRLGQSGAGELLNSFLKRGCAVCDRPASSPISKSFCLDCHRQLQQQIMQETPSKAAPAAAPFSITAVGAYDGTLKRAILALKYENRPDVAHFLGTALAQVWKTTQQQAKPLYALPIPLHKDRQRQRGYNQAALLARAFCQTNGIALIETGLVRSQATIPQHQLNLEARQQNLANVFEVDRSLAKRQKKLKQRGQSLKVVIVDDIYTTGATVQSAIGVLSRAGVAVVGVATVAKT